MPERPLRVGYATADASAIADLVERLYDVGQVKRCHLLRRGFNDTYMVETASGERYVLRLGALRARGAPNADYETAFLAFLKSNTVPVADAVAASDGRLWRLVPMPEGERPAVLFRFAAGRDPDRASPLDAAAQGRTLAAVHRLGEGYEGPPSLYRLDLGHLLERPLAAFLGLPGFDPGDRLHFEEIATRIAGEISARESALAWVQCHGDCVGQNAKIAEDGPLARSATFYDFDEGGPGFLAYDLAVFLWSHIHDQRARAVWPAFLAGYRSVRPIAEADVEAIPLFVIVRHFWLMGEYARRSAEWGTEWLSPAWLKRELEQLSRWEDASPSSRRLL